MENFEERQWIELLEGPSNQLITRLHITPDFLYVRSFALVYVHDTGKEAIEIIKVDGSEKERVHIHNGFHHPPTKEYHSRPPSVETIAYYSESIHQNWRFYLSRYRENYI